MKKIFLTLCLFSCFCFSNSILAAAEEDGNIDDIFVEIEDSVAYRVKHIYKRDEANNYIVELKLKYKNEYLGGLKLIFDSTCTRVSMMDMFLPEGMSDFREILTTDAITLINLLLYKKRVNNRVTLTTSTWFSEDENKEIHKFYKSKGFSATRVMFGHHYVLHFF